MGPLKTQDLSIFSYCLYLILLINGVIYSEAAFAVTPVEYDVFRTNSMAITKFVDLNTKTIAHKDYLRKYCFIEKINNQTIWTNERVLMKIYPRLLTNDELLSISGTRVADFCFGWPAKVLLPSTATDSRFKRSDQPYFFVGRKARGQSQSQYLQFGTSEPGKAEAESTRQGSKAIVYGTSGMGQAQSQSDPFNCADCYGTDQGSSLRGQSTPGSFYQPGRYQQTGQPGNLQYGPTSTQITGGRVDGSHTQDPRTGGVYSGQRFNAGSGDGGTSLPTGSIQPGQTFISTGGPGTGQYPSGTVPVTGSQTGTPGGSTQTGFPGSDQRRPSTSPQFDGQRGPGLHPGGPDGTQHTSGTGLSGTGQIGVSHIPGTYRTDTQFTPGGQVLYTPDGKIITGGQHPGSHTYPSQSGQTLIPGGGGGQGLNQQLYGNDGLQKPSGKPGWTGSDTEQFNRGEQSVGPPSHYDQSTLQPGQGTFRPGQSTQQPGHSLQQPGQTIHHPGQSTYQPGQSTQQPGHSLQQPGQTIHHPGQSTYHPGQTIYQPGQTTLQPGQTTYHPGQNIYQPGQFPGQSTQPGLIVQHPGQLILQPGQSIQHSGQPTHLPGQPIHQPQQPTQQPEQPTFQPGQTTYFIPGGIRPRPGETGTYIPGRDIGGTRQYGSGLQGGTFSGHLTGEYQSPANQGGAFSGSFEGRYNTHGKTPQLIYEGSLPGGGQGVITSGSSEDSAGNLQIWPDSKLPGGVSTMHVGTLPTGYPSGGRGHSQVYYPGGSTVGGVTGTDHQGTSIGSGLITPGTGDIGIEQSRPGGGYVTTIPGGPQSTITTNNLGGQIGGDGRHTTQVQYPGTAIRTDGGIPSVPGSYGLGSGTYPGQTSVTQPVEYLPGQQLGQQPGTIFTSHHPGQYPATETQGRIQAGIQGPSGQTTGTTMPSATSQQGFNQQYPPQLPGQQTGSLGPSGSQSPSQYGPTQGNQQLSPGYIHGPQGSQESQYSGSQFGTGGSQGQRVNLYGPQPTPGQAVNIHGQPVPGQGVNIYGQQPGALTFGSNGNNVQPYGGQGSTGIQGGTTGGSTQPIAQTGPGSQIYTQTGPGGIVQQSTPADDSDSQAQSSIQRVNNETQASASSSGRFAGGNAQSQVSGSYSGQGSFSASAGTNDGLRGAQTQVSGNREGALSSSQGQGGKGKSQAQVQLSAETGDTTSSAQTGGVNHGTNTQVQSGIKGGMADAQANGPGSTSSQAQIGFTPYDANNNEDVAEHPHNGGGTASASSGTHAGKSQVQINGKYAFGIQYTGQAQASSANSGFTASDFNLPTMKPIDFTQNKYEKPARQQEKVNVRQIEEAKILQVVARSTTLPPEEDMRDSDYDDEDYEEPERMNLEQQQQTRSLIHDALDPLEDIEEPVRIQLPGRLKNGDVIHPGQFIPGSNGYKIPVGFRGRITEDSHAEGDNTRRIVYAAGVKTNRHSNTGYGAGYHYQQQYSPIEYGFKSGTTQQQQQPKFVSVTKSETGSRNVLTGKKTPSVYYTQSSTCGYFTNTCVYSNGKKICMPKPKANADGTPIACRN